MIARPELAALTPAKRAQVIYAEAQSQLSNRLWRAALGDSDKPERENSPFAPAGMNMDSLLGLLGGQNAATPSGGSCACHCACDDEASAPGPGASRRNPHIEYDRTALAAPTEMVSGSAAAVGASGLELGSNARYAATFAAAEARTGIPASALAAIVDAEAGKSGDGSWNAHSRNPRSSAAGLGQFLSGTWEGLAETRGTWLNEQASARGWLDSNGRLQGGARAECLALRYDPQASILGVADYAKCNLDRLAQDGVRVHTDSETLAKAAYLSHHLGLGDARKFLSGGIEAGRARTLLTAQIGSSAAEQRIASAGDATQAHRQWLLGFIGKRIRPEQFGG